MTALRPIRLVMRRKAFFYLVAVVGCATSTPSQHSRQTVRACSANDSVAAATIRLRLSDWVAQTNHGDRTAANTIWAPGVIGWFPRGPEFSDSAAYSVAGIASTTGRPTVTYELQVVDVAVDGALAVVHDIWKEHRQFAGSTVTVNREIRGSEMWRCQPDGSWRIVRWVSAPEHWVRSP